MKKYFLLPASMLVALCAAAFSAAPNEPAGSDYELAQRFAGPKLGNMLFSTTVNPAWVPTGDAFYYSFKTGDGTKWYIVETAKNKKSPLFDHDKLAA